MFTLTYFSLLLGAMASLAAPQGLYRRRSHHTCVRLGNYIYIEGENATWSIDVSKDWTNASLQPISIPRPSNDLHLNRQALWPDRKANIIYAFGGEENLDGGTAPASPGFLAPAEALWMLLLDGQGSGTWTELYGPEGQKPFPSDIIRPAKGASASDAKNAYYLGGYSGLSTSAEVKLDLGQRRPVPGLLTFGLDSQTLVNSSNDGGYFASRYSDASSYNSSAYAGTMISVPLFGSNGTFIIFGGEDTSRPAGAAARGFSLITIFDPNSGLWYSQVASGQIPSLRHDYCVVGVQSMESTFEIFISGGIAVDKALPIGSSDVVYVLSLPAFHWFKANYTTPSQRYRHSCVAVGNQMIAVGGMDPTQAVADSHEDNWNETADPMLQGISVLNLTSLQDQHFFQANASEYIPPDAITSYYASNPRYPARWSSPGVQTLFTTIASTTAANGPTMPSPQGSSFNSIHLAIALSVVAVVLILGGLAGVHNKVAAVYRSGLWRIRRKRCAARDGNNELEVREKRQEMDAEARREELEAETMRHEIQTEDTAPVLEGDMRRHGLNAVNSPVDLRQ